MMNFKYKYSIPKIKCKEEISTGFLVSKDKVITTVHSIKEHLYDEDNLIEVIFRDNSGNQIIRSAIPIFPKNKDLSNFKLIALKLNEDVKDISALECINYTFEHIEDAFTYGYPAVRQEVGTLIELKVLGNEANGYVDLKGASDLIQDYGGCSGGPLIYKNFIVGIMLEQVLEDGVASRISVVSFSKYEEYFEEIGLELFEKASDIYKFDEYLMGCTKPKISLGFFDYDDKEFEEEFLGKLKTQTTIYLQGKTKEEVMGYALYIIKTKARHLIPKVKIVDGLEKWNELKDNCENKILIPNFNANKITVIPKNINIILHGEEDFVGNKDKIVLNKRTLDNMRNKLNGDIDDLTLAHQLVRQSNGFYSIFKRKVFEGKNGKPQWEEHTGPNLLPGLLACSWEDNPKDKIFIEQLTSLKYDDYIESLKNTTNGEDPFLLHYNTGNQDKFTLANVEESWEILFPEITQNKLETFKNLALEVLSEVASKFELPVSEHYISDLLTDKRSEFSSTLKKGIARSLIELSLKESNSLFVYQEFVDDIIRQLFIQMKDSQQWFAIAEVLPLLAEASPHIFIEFIEKEVENSESKIWELFENSVGGFFGRNYYTNLLWALEKLLCLESTVLKSINILVKLSEREINYNISNTPISTLAHAFCGWLHVINLSIDEKIDLVEDISKNSSIGWELLKQILPDRNNDTSMANMSRLVYRPYEIEYKLEYNDQIYETFKKYTAIAINNANNDLEKWEMIFEKCVFTDLGLYDLVKEKLIQGLCNNESDKQKYIFKEKLRFIIYRHRFYKNSDWALKEEEVKHIEELFNLVNIGCSTYNYLYLFTNRTLIDLNPKPYVENKSRDFSKERHDLREKRVFTLKSIINDPDDSIWNLINILKEHDTNTESQYVIGNILASDIENFNLNFKILDEAIENSAETLLISYIETIYKQKGITVIESTIDFFNTNDDLVVSILGIARIDEKILQILDSLSTTAQSKYWEKCMINGDKVDDLVKEVVWSELIKHKNYFSLIDIVELYFEKNLEKNIIVLEEILSNQKKNIITNQNSFLIVNMFENIYSESNQNIDRSIYLRVCRLEWGFFDLLFDEIEPKFLLKNLKKEPMLVASLIKSAYKSTKKDIIVIEKNVDLSMQSANILRKLKFCPGINETNDPCIIEESLEAWVKVFLKEIDKSGHEKIGRQFLGECFAYSPQNGEEIFPVREICSVFEKYYTEDLGTGFIIGVLNKRGVFWGSEGKREKSLAIKFEKYSKKVRVKYPKISSALLRVSKSYTRSAFQERERASYEL